MRPPAGKLFTTPGGMGTCVVVLDEGKLSQWYPPPRVMKHFSVEEIEILPKFEFKMKARGNHLPFG
jgi:hypothetical protein